MNEYVAVLRLGPSRTGAAAPPIWAAARACKDTVAGVTEAEYDAVGSALVVRFNRARSTVADIVRALEDHGLAIIGVAQSRADAGARVIPA